jgi:hypothetical protein
MLCRSSGVTLLGESVDASNAVQSVFGIEVLSVALGVLESDEVICEACLLEERYHIVGGT